MKNFKAMLSLMTVSSLLLSSCTTYQRGMRTPSSNDDVYKTVSRKLVIQKIHPLAPKADPFYTVYSGISGIPVQVEVSDASNLDCKILGTTDDAEVETPSDVRGGSHYFNVSDNQQVRCQVRPDSTDVAVETEIKYHVVRQTLPVDDNTEISLNEELLRLKALLQDKKQLSTADFLSLIHI